MSVNSQWGMLCPSCGRDDSLKVKFTGWATLTEDGTDDDSDHEWDNDSECLCSSCGYQAQVKEFDLGGDKLFNCYPANAEPDWSEFDALEVGGCANDADEDLKKAGETCIVGGKNRSEAEFFTVYGHFAPASGEVGVSAITDADSFEEAERIAGVLSKRSGLPINIVC